MATDYQLPVLTRSAQDKVGDDRSVNDDGDVVPSPLQALTFAVSWKRLTWRPEEYLAEARRSLWLLSINV